MPRARKKRTRARYVTVNYRTIQRNTNKLIESTTWTATHDTLTDFTIPPGPMSREVTEIWSGHLRTHGPLNDLTDVFVENYPFGPGWVHPDTTRYVWEPYVNNLKWSKLPTSNEADLLTNLAELDDTIAMFGKSLKETPSYGSYKWGWAPLVNDVLACNDAANRVKQSLLNGNRRTSRYNATHQIKKSSGDIPVSGGIFYHAWDVKVKHIGHITIENDILSFYDYLGFHPSPKLLWDLVPLSFAVDYILPIGDMLRQLTPQKGWVKSANFTGWRIITADVREVVKKPPSGYNNCSFEANSGRKRFVFRDYLDGVALEQKRIPRAVDLIKVPSLEQICDLSYLSRTFHSKVKGMVSPLMRRK